MNTKHNEKKYTIRRDAKNVYFTDDTETGALPLYGFPEKYDRNKSVNMLVKFPLNK